MPETLRKQLAEFIQATGFADLDAAVTQRAKHCLLDLIGVAIAGSGQPTSILAREVLGACAPPPEATLWTTDQHLSVSAAACINAIQGHAIDMDDGHRYANGHPGVVTIPAAIAMAERAGLDGRDLITAVVIGYEVFIRLGRSINPSLLNRGFHTTATVGTFAASAVAAKCLGLSVAQTENALSLAGLQSAGLLEALSSGEMGKSFQVGRAVQSGIVATLMAAGGADGPEQIFEGDKGFCRAFAGTNCDVDSIRSGLGTDFQIINVYFKRHAACRHIHSALDAIAEIIAEMRIDPAAVEAIDVETYTVAKNLTGHLATGGGELAAKFSLPVAIGLLLVFNRTDALAFTRENLAHPLVRAVAEKVSIQVSADRDAVYPGKRGAEVVLRAGGSSFRREVIYPKGEPEYPLSQEELEEKFRINAGFVYKDEIIRDIHERVMSIEKLETGALTKSLRAPLAAG